jgi:hypothetical protein
MDRLTTKNVIRLGLQKSAVSLTKFSGEIILLGVCDGYTKIKGVREINSYNTALISEINSDEKALSIFLMCDDEKDKIVSGVNKTNNTEISELDVLLEVNNIITASTVTNIGNRTNKFVYAGVPKVNTTENMSDYIKDVSKSIGLDLEKGDYIAICTEFISLKFKTNPKFVWILPKNFYENL